MIRVTREDGRGDGIVTVALDRAAARNAVSMQGWHDLAAAFASVDGDDRVLLLVSAVPGIFSAGADLAMLARLADHPAERAPFREAMQAAIAALAAVPVPTIAAIAGGCHGAAVALVLAADLRVIGKDARFAVPPARLGIAYPPGDVARLAERVGAAQAARLLFSAEAIDADEALRIGLADVTGDGVALARTIAANDPAAVRILKAMLRDPDRGSHAAAFDATFDSAAFRLATRRFRS